MKNDDQKDTIKRALLGGGLIVAKRGAGKSSAIAEILNEDPSAVAVIRNEATRRVLLNLGVNKDQIISAELLDGSLLFGKIEDKRLYGDELSLAQIERVMQRREFHAAVTSFSFPVRVIK